VWNGVQLDDTCASIDSRDFDFERLRLAPHDTLQECFTLAAVRGCNDVEQGRVEDLFQSLGTEECKGLFVGRKKRSVSREAGQAEGLLLKNAHEVRCAVGLSQLGDVWGSDQ
jgi:hypothetical protein